MNKLTKVLSVFIIAGALGASVAGIAGCKKGGHTHKIDTTKWVDNEDGATHDGFCSCGELLVDGEEHVPDDGVCVKCGAIEGAEAVTITGVTVSAAGGASSVAVEGKLQLSATVTGTGNYPHTVTWSSSDDGKATVSDTGEVTGVDEGSVTITATSTKDTGKSNSITLTVVAKGSVITIPDYATLVAQADKLYNNDFETAAARLPDFSGTYGGTRGVYTDFAVNKDEAGATKDTHYVKVEGGKAVQVNPGKGTAYTVVDFGAIKGDIEGYVEVTLSEAASGMTFVQFIGDSSAKTGSEVFGIRTDGDEVKYRLDGGSTYVSATPAIAKVAQMSVYFKYFEGKMTVAVNGKFLCKNLETSITKLSGFRLASGDSNTRTVNGDNLVICGEEITAAEYKPIAIANLDAEYAKYKLTGEGATHVTNGSLVTEAYNDGKTAIGAKNTISEINAAYNAAVAAMKDVLSDAQIPTAKAAAEAALDEKFPSNNYTYAFADGSADAIYNNQATYGTEIAAIKAQIANGATTQSNLDAIVAAATISVGNNAAQLAAKKTAATANDGDIATYRADKIAEIATEHATQYANIGTIKATAITDINAATTTTIEAINAIIAQAKADIDGEITATEETLEQTIARYQGLLEADGTTAKTGVTDQIKLDAVDAAVTAGKAAIAAVASKDGVSGVYNQEKAKVALVIPKIDAKAEILTGKNEAAAEIHGDGEEATKATTDVTKAYTDGVKAIDDATTKTAVDKAVDDAQLAISNAIKALKDTKFDVTVAISGATETETLSIKYGTQLKLGDIAVTGMNVTAATYGNDNTEITAESGVTVYGELTVNVTTADKSNYKPAENWKAPAVTDTTNGDAAEATIASNGLFEVTSNVPATQTYFNLSATVGENTYTGSWRADVAQNATAESMLTVTVKDNLKTLKIALGHADSKWNSNRTGSITVKLNGEVYDTVVGNSTKASKLIEFTNLQGGDKITVDVTNSDSKYGSYLHLFEVDAAIDTAKVPKLVTVEWQNEDGTVWKSKKYSYLEKITAPDGSPTVSGAFTGWQYNGSALPADLKLSSSSTAYVMTPISETADVTINYTDGETTKPLSYLSTATDNALPAPANSDETHLFLGYYLQSGDAPADTDTEFDISTVTEGEYAVYAKYLQSNVTIVYKDSADDAGETVHLFLKADGSLVDADDEEATLKSAPTAPADKPKFDGWFYTDGDNEIQFKLADVEVGGSYTVTAKFSEVKEVTMIFTVDASNDEIVTTNTSGLVTITSAGDIGDELKNTEITIDGNKYKPVQVNKGTKSAYLTFDLAEGYKYDIKIYMGSTDNSKGRKVTLNGIEQTGNAGKVDFTTEVCTWTDISSGKISSTVDGNTYIACIVITAKPLT